MQYVNFIRASLILAFFYSSVCYSVGFNLFFSSEQVPSDALLVSDYFSRSYFDCSDLDVRQSIGSSSNLLFADDQYFLSNWDINTRMSPSSSGCRLTHFVVFHSNNSHQVRLSEPILFENAVKKTIKFMCDPALVSSCGFTHTPSTDPTFDDNSDGEVCASYKGVIVNGVCECDAVGEVYFPDQDSCNDPDMMCPLSSPSTISLQSYKESALLVLQSYLLDGIEFGGYAACSYLLDNKTPVSGQSDCFDFYFSKVDYKTDTSPLYDLDSDFQTHECNDPDGIYLTGLGCSDDPSSYTDSFYENVDDSIYTYIEAKQVLETVYYAYGDCAYRFEKTNIRDNGCFDLTRISVDGEVSKFVDNSSSSYLLAKCEDEDTVTETETYTDTETETYTDTDDDSVPNFSDQSYQDLIEEVYQVRQSQDLTNEHLLALDVASADDLDDLFQQFKPYLDSEAEGQDELIDAVKNIKGSDSSLSDSFFQSLLDSLTGLNQKVSDVSDKLEVDSDSTKGSFTVSQEEVDLAKVDYKTRVQNTQAQIQSFFTLTKVASVDTLSKCFQIPTLSGNTKQVCLERYQDELKLVGSMILFMCALASVFIVLGGSRR